jgi:phosphatidylglycerophosphatase A
MPKNQSINIAPRSLWQNPWHFIAFGFGSGAMPYMPGTFGTLITIPLYLLIQDYSLLTYSAIVILATLFGVLLCGIASKELGVHDHPGMVWDEVAGYGITMIGVPKGWLWIWLGFILFRLFDIWKPGPIGYIDRHVHGGLGIMLDDVCAAIPAWLILQALAYIMHVSIFFN